MLQAGRIGKLARMGSSLSLLVRAFLSWASVNTCATHLLSATFLSEPCHFTSCYAEARAPCRCSSFSTLAQHPPADKYFCNADTLTGLTRTSTFLPEVAAHERWDQQQTIDALVRKSGYVGTVSPEIRGRLKVIRYQSTTASLSHAQYLLRLGSRPLGANCMPVPEPTVVAVPA